MNSPKVSELSYISFLLAAPSGTSCTQAQEVFQGQLGDPSHDAFNRLLERQASNTIPLWEESERMIEKEKGIVVIDDSVLDKPYAPNNELAVWQWSGKHHRVRLGIGLITLLWTNGHAVVPVDFRIYDKHLEGGATKNEHFRAMLEAAIERGMKPKYVAFDSWYASIENLKLIREKGLFWFTRLPKNRLVKPDGTGNVTIETVDIGRMGRRVHLRKYGYIWVFRTVNAAGESQYWATNDLLMTQDQQRELVRQGWSIEVYHRALKQCCNIESSQARKASVQRGHILLSLRTFLRLEAYRLRTKISWYKAKQQIILSALQSFVKNPWIPLQISTA